jgi:RNA recognition motif-containing protein
MGNRLYVGNLSFSATEQTLRDAFASHGDVTDVHVVIDRMTGQSRGFGFVTMGSQNEASAAIQAMNPVAAAAVAAAAAAVAAAAAAAVAAAAAAEATAGEGHAARNRDAQQALRLQPEPGGDAKQHA